MSIIARRKRTLGLAVAVAGLLASMPPAGAQDKGAPAAQEKTMTFEETDTIVTVLKRLEGKPVKLRLAGGGEEISGKLSKVGPDIVHVEALSGREFFDAVIRTDQVAAVVVQVRSR